MSSIEIIEVPSEIAAGTRGASLGVAALHIAALNASNSFFCEHTVTRVADENHRLCEDTPYACAKRIDGVSTMFRRVCQEVARSSGEGHFPLVVAGDHSTAAATIAGLRKTNTDDRLGVIWVDAHADLHSPYTSPSGNVHGMPLAAALNLDNKEKQANSPDKTTLQLWEHLKETGTDGAKIKPQDVFLIGLRDLEYQEQHIIDQHKIPHLHPEQIRENGVDHVIQKALSQLSHCDRLYISFDVDSLDPTVSRGTGTPSDNGLYVEEATQILHGLMKDERVCGLELVEVNPLLDTKNRMAEVAFSILLKALEPKLQKGSEVKT